MNVKKGFYEYEVEYWDDFKTDKDHPHGKMTTAKGICYASSYAKATKKIEKSYDNIETIHIAGLEPDFCYDINLDPYKLDGCVLNGGKY